MLLDLLHISVENYSHRYKYEIISTRQKNYTITCLHHLHASLSASPVVFTEERKSMVSRWLYKEPKWLSSTSING